MGKELINIRIGADQQTNLDLKRWAKNEGKSKRQHAAILLRKLTWLRKTNPEDLARLGLLDRSTFAT